MPGPHPNESQRNGWRDRQFILAFVIMGFVVATFLISIGMVHSPISTVANALAEHREMTRAIAQAVERQTSVLRMICRNTTYDNAVKRECDQL